MTVFDWPAKAAFGRTVPKNAIYEHAHVKTSLKELFVSQVERIVWDYKLAPETINTPASDAVPEIQVFGLTIRGENLKDDLLRCIDKAIPFPLLFELRRQGQVSYTAAYKRPSEADSGAWVVSGYFTSGWLPDDSPRTPLPFALNLESLYAALLAPLLPYPARAGESLAAHVARVEEIQSLQRQTAKLEAALRKEKQFNRKITVNRDLRTLQEQIARLVTVKD
jgi:hypothetical protein